MNHLVLFLTCILSVELLIRSKFLIILDSIINVTRKVIFVIPSNKISDHWKERVIPSYALKIMKFSLQILLILSCIFTLFIIVDLFLESFIVFTLSLMGILESVIFAFGYIFLRKLFLK